jgi:hypothetical protein
MNGWSNDDLAERRRHVREVTGQAMQAAARQQESRNPASPTNPPPRPIDEGPLSEQDIRFLFYVLKRGSEAHLGRPPTGDDLHRLVEAINQARVLVRQARLALDDKADVFWNGSDWSFPPRKNDGPTRIAA